MGYLVDSNVLIDYIAERFDPEKLTKLDLIFDVELNTSVISKIEVLGFAVPEAEAVKLHNFFSIANVIGLTNEICELTILLRKSVKIKIPDAIIAATAIIHNLTLISRNLKDFKDLPDLIIKDPYTL